MDGTCPRICPRTRPQTRPQQGVRFRPPFFVGSDNFSFALFRTSLEIYSGFNSQPSPKFRSCPNSFRKVLSLRQGPESSPLLAIETPNEGANYMSTVVSMHPVAVNLPKQFVVEAS